MNTTRIQTNFLKMLMNEQSVYVLKEEIPRMVGITEGHAVYFIPECEFFLDRAKMKEVDLKNIVEQFNNSSPAIRTGIERKDKGKLVEVKTVESQVSIWLDEKFVKDFSDYAEYYGTYDVSPVFVKENGILVGIVLPVKIK